MTPKVTKINQQWTWSVVTTSLPCTVWVLVILNNPLICLQHRKWQHTHDFMKFMYISNCNITNICYSFLTIVVKNSNNNRAINSSIHSAVWQFTSTTDRQTDKQTPHCMQCNHTAKIKLYLTLASSSKLTQNCQKLPKF